MSYYFTILGPHDNPIFEHEFGTSKHGGDGLARFAESARHMNQFIVHSSLDIVEEVQWTTPSSSSFPTNSTSSSSSSSYGHGQQYLKVIDRFYNNYVSCFLTGGNVKFLLLHSPADGTGTVVGAGGRNSSSIGTNPTSPQMEEAIRQFFLEVYENWIKCLMNPFFGTEMQITSLVFRQRVGAAGKKYL